MISVTLTGADDAVDPRELVVLSKRFPFVEWGILCSVKRAGTPRYPTSTWVLAALRGASEGARFSAHLCGAQARAFASGAPVGLPSPSFARVQVNGYESAQLFGLAAAVLRLGLAGLASPEIVLQCREEATLQEVCRDAEKLPRASVLFDPSGGRGLEPFRWPPTPLGARLGFAGGIKPETVEEVITRIYADGDFRRGDFWIDLESGVRDEADRFDLDRAEEVLRAVELVNGRD